MEIDSINYDILLTYLSYKKHGTWSDFKKYIQSLLYSKVDKNILKNIINETCRMLSSLGHVEFLFGNKSYYSIAPQAIAMFNNSYKGVLCGCRTNEFLETLRDLCDELDINYIEKENYNAPKSIIIDFKNQYLLDKFQEKCKKGFINISFDFSFNLINQLPSIDNVIKNLEPVDFDRSESGVKIFNRDFKNNSFGFVDVRGIGERDWSVYEVSYFTHKDYILCDDMGKYYKVDKNTALCTYFNKNYNKVIHYSHSNNSLVFKHSKYSNYIPELFDRALTLSTGMNRRCEGGIIIYDNISIELASLVSEKLGLDIKERHE